MLGMMRNASGGWLTKIFLFLLAASFAVFGVSASIFSGPGSSVISVGDTTVDVLDYRLAYSNRVNAISRQLGTQITTTQAANFGIPQTVLTNLTSGAVLDENTRKMGLGISQEKLAGIIGDDTSFHDASGNFSRLQLQGVLRQIGMSEEQYVKNRTAVAIRSQLIQGVAQNTKLPDVFYDLLGKSRAEKRIFEYATLTASDIEPITPPSNSDVQTFYDDNKINYQAPEFRKVILVKLQAADIADEVGVTQEEIEAEYEATKKSFTKAETREIQQLIFTDRAKAESVAKRLEDGATFDEILIEQNKTSADVTIGNLPKTDISDKNIADAAFALSLNKTSKIVDGLFGTVILRVVEINPQSIKPLSEVEDGLRKSIALKLANDNIFDTHDKIEDDRAAGETLIDSAKLSNLTPRIIESIDSTGRDINGDLVKNLPEITKLITEIFSAGEGVETSPIQISADGFVWYEVEKITETRLKTLDEVKQEAIKDWTSTETDKAIEVLATSVQKKLTSGMTLEAILKDITKLEDVSSRIQKSAALLRTDTSKDLNAITVQSGFSIKQDTANVTNSTDNNGNTGKTILTVSEIIVGEKLPIPQNNMDQLDGALQNDLLTALVGKLQNKQPVTINQEAIAAAFTQGSY